MSFNKQAPLSLNGIVHQAPPGFEDSLFAYVLNPPLQYFSTNAYLIYFAQQGMLSVSGLQLTAVTAGTGGNAITFQVIQGSGGSTTVAVVGNAITITLKSTGDTMAGVATVLNGNGSVTALVSIATITGGATAAVLGTTNLYGGGTSTGIVLAANGVVGYKNSFLTNTQADSIFVAYGIEVPVINNASTFTVGFRIRWNNEFLTEDYIYSGGTGAMQGTSVAPIPIFPPKILPPQSLLNVDLINLSASTIYNYPLTLVGYKRRKLS